ncbi:hypothetical protein [Floccifex sp.]|uniref:hypothetical protein n=1 Tax=Floccifex sp. TaxID=2815810 RepID=UPI003F070464
MTYKDIFKKDVSNNLYPFFWQHGENHEVLKEYIDKIYESGMKGLCIEARPHPEYLQAKWWSDLDLIISECKKKSMKVWILDDSHFPTGYANGKVVTKYPQYLKKYLNCRCYDVHGPINRARINLNILKGRVWDKPDASDRVLKIYMAKRINLDEQYVDKIDDTTLVDITDNFNVDTRLLTVDIADGAYRIFVIFETNKGLEEATKDYLNPLVKEATQVLIDEVYEKHYAHYADEFGKTITAFFSDEPRFGNIKGTDASIGMDMPLPYCDGLFEKLDFDLRYLPLLWFNANGMESTIRFKYMDLITKLYNENFTKVLADWCSNHSVMYVGHTIEDNGAHARLGYGTGHYFRGQEAMHMAGIDVIGTQIVPGMNYHHDAFNTGGANGEFYHYALAKLGTSSAYLDPKKKGNTMCEAFGAYGWNEGLKTMKWISDSLMARGVNHFVPHAFNPKDFPDWDCPPHFYAHGNNPQFRYFKILDDYINRVTSMFSEGMYPCKIGVLYPAEFEWAGAYMPIEKVCKVLTQSQLSYNIVTRDYLMNALLNQGSYIINQTEFEVLVIPYTDNMPRDLLEVLIKMHNKNIKVIFVNKMFNNVLDINSDENLDVICEFEVVDINDLGNRLKKYQSVELEKDYKELVMHEYLKDNYHIYMFFNESTYIEVNTSINFDKDRNVYVYNAFEDQLYESDNTLSLTPYESKIYLVTKEKLIAKKQNKICDYQDVNIDINWDVSYANAKDYPNFKLIEGCHSLCCIEEIEGYETSVGTVRYSGEFVIDKRTNIILDLGNVYETCQVYVNDVLVDTKICKPYVFDLTNLIVEGKNSIYIEVTNTLGTEIRDGLSSYLPIERFGIEGPVVFKSKK